MKRLGVLEFELVTMKRFETKVIRAIARSGSFKNTFGTALEEFEKYEPRVLILERELFELEDSIIGKVSRGVATPSSYCAYQTISRRKRLPECILTAY